MVTGSSPCNAASRCNTDALVAKLCSAQWTIVRSKRRRGNVCADRVRPAWSGVEADIRAVAEPNRSNQFSDLLPPCREHCGDICSQDIQLIRVDYFLVPLNKRIPQVAIRSFSADSNLARFDLSQVSIIDIIIHDPLARISPIFSACVAVVAVVGLGSAGGASAWRGETAEGRAFTTLGSKFFVRSPSALCSFILTLSASGENVLPAASTQSP